MKNIVKVAQRVTPILDLMGESEVIEEKASEIQILFSKTICISLISGSCSLQRFTKVFLGKLLKSKEDCELIGPFFPG